MINMFDRWKFKLGQTSRIVRFCVVAGVSIVVLAVLSCVFSPGEVFGDLAHWPLRADVWGTTGQWIGSILTGISFFLAYKVYRGTVERELRAQSALVTFDIIVTKNRYRGTINNHSAAMIKDVYLVFNARTKADYDRQIPKFTKIARTVQMDCLLNAGSSSGFIAPISETEYQSIRPASEFAFDQPSEHIFSSHEFAVKLVFTDAAGTQWIRYDDNGKLELFGN